MTVRTEQRITQMGGGTRISPAVSKDEKNIIKFHYFHLTEIDVVVDCINCRRNDKLKRGL